MALQSELAWLVKQRCEEIGLTPQRLSEISVGRLETVRQLLEGTHGDIGISDAECIANSVGLSVGVLNHRPRRERKTSAAVLASRTASTSFAEVLPPDVLMQSLSSGSAATEYAPHIRTLLEEAPMGLLADLAYELLDQRGIPAPQTWQKMRAMAGSLGCIRSVWQ